jgi:hypothetical protein
MARSGSNQIQHQHPTKLSRHRKDLPNFRRTIEKRNTYGQTSSSEISCITGKLRSQWDAVPGSSAFEIHRPSNPDLHRGKLSSMPKRKLRVVKWVGSTPASGVCEFCSKQFKVPLTEMARTSQADDNLQEQFDRHKCRRLDSSQNALPIVKEATDSNCFALHLNDSFPYIPSSMQVRLKCFASSKHPNLLVQMPSDSCRTA